MTGTSTIISVVLFGVAALCFGVANPTSAKTVIRTDMVQFEAEKIRYKSDETFIITSLPSLCRRACDGQVIIGLKSTGSSLQTYQLPGPHFELDSAELSHVEIARLLKNVQACHIGLDTRVNVTGYTCRLGTEAHNQNLSLRRAERVADLLRQQGYTIGEVTGKGPDCPVAGEDHLELNRRVEFNYQNLRSADQ